MKVLLISLGCDKNLVDSEVMLGLLNKAGHQLTNDETEADVVVVNTCAFISDAKEESINTIIEMGELKKTGKLKKLIVAVGLSMDAFAVSVCKGLSLGKIKPKHMCIAGAWFGGFQALMPLIGYFLGSFFAEMIEKYDHWVAFVLLAIIGGNMIKESFGKDEKVDSSMDVKSMLLLAIATSIDALAVGVTFAFLQVQIVPAVSFIGVITFIFSAVGVKIGSLFGTKYKSKAELFGGIVLVLIGIKILLEGIGVLG